MNQFEKQIVNTDVWEKETNVLALKDIPKEYLEEGYYLYTTTYDGDVAMFIEHQRLETDEEYKIRIDKHKKSVENSNKIISKMEYQNYLKLKAKFEGNDGSN